jgi:hypothetical protein
MASHSRSLVPARGKAWDRFRQREYQVTGRFPAAPPKRFVSLGTCMEFIFGGMILGLVAFGVWGFILFTGAMLGFPLERRKTVDRRQLIAQQMWQDQLAATSPYGPLKNDLRAAKPRRAQCPVGARHATGAPPRSAHAQHSNSSSALIRPIVIVYCWQPERRRRPRIQHGIRTDRSADAAAIGGADYARP